ncbi:imelysin family protein [Yoonia sp. I 8.24]|uniref:imelysin family protein n=1 Tax=Yoonia sp. I 8.24 TaxID=1537229 RepID=UPI001EDCF003|nr:imelysin family protein [Yoonia sp. I 8.24]MCG3266876.1 imelysin family protein [Yoonia sp. I 8.24]
MKRLLLAFSVTLVATGAPAQSLSDLTSVALDTHVLPGYARLAAQSQVLADVAQDDCDAASPVLTAAYGDAFDAWIGVSHMRFGPSEVDDRAFALAFWPDSRGVTPRSLLGLISDEDPIGLDAAAYADVSIAARGFYALEFLLYDDAVATAGSDSYRCALIQTVTADIAILTQAIDAEWRDSYADLLRHPSDTGIYRSDEEAAQELFKAVSTGLEFLGDTRLGRPLGTFDRPRPTRAEVWRSQRSQRHVTLSLAALRELALVLSADDVQVHTAMENAFDRAQDRIARIDDPAFAGVSDPSGRFVIEVLQQEISAIRTVVRNELGPKLGVVAGFNALDGD